MHYLIHHGNVPSSVKELQKTKWEKDEIWNPIDMKRDEAEDNWERELMMYEFRGDENMLFGLDYDIKEGKFIEKEYKPRFVDWKY